MKNYRKSLVVCAVVLAVAAATLAVAPQRGRPLRAELPQPEDATPIEEGVMTERQKAHGKIYKGYADMVGRRKIKDLIDAGDGVEVWASISCDQVMPPIELSTFLKRLTCGADAVVFGVVKGQASQLDESGSFLFTDYEVALSEVLKSDDPSLRPGEEITVVRGGGAVIHNNRLVRAIDPNHGRVKVGEDYSATRSSEIEGNFEGLRAEVKEATSRINS